MVYTMFQIMWMEWTKWYTQCLRLCGWIRQIGIHNVSDYVDRLDKMVYTMFPIMWIEWTKWYTQCFRLCG